MIQEGRRKEKEEEEPGESRRKRKTMMPEMALPMTARLLMPATFFRSFQKPTSFLKARKAKREWRIATR